jgi:hypothetical protein
MIHGDAVLLRTRLERPRRHSAAEERDEIVALTSAAELKCRQAVKFWGEVGSVIRRLGLAPESRRSGGIVRR